MSSQVQPPPPEQNHLEKLDVFKIKGKDKQGRRILRITGKFFPARTVSLDVVKKHLEEKIFPRLKNKRFTILYFHTGVQRSQNFPGIAALRSIYDAIPAAVKANLEAVYFVHPDLQARLFLATLGRIFFTSDLSASTPSPRAPNAASTPPNSSAIWSFSSHATAPLRIRTFDTNVHRFGFDWDD